MTYELNSILHIDLCVAQIFTSLVRLSYSSLKDLEFKWITQFYTNSKKMMQFEMTALREI